MTEEVTARWGVSDSTLTRRITAGDLHPIRDRRDRRRRLFPVDELNEVFGPALTAA